MKPEGFSDSLLSNVFQDPANETPFLLKSVLPASSTMEEYALTTLSQCSQSPGRLNSSRYGPDSHKVNRKSSIASPRSFTATKSSS